ERTTAMTQPHHPPFEGLHLQLTLALGRTMGAAATEEMDAPAPRLSRPHTGAAALVRHAQQRDWRPERTRRS
ncbi:MAG: hypothetical protein ACRDQ5_19750, partial [Sciscionella sp.]